jgi:hypothetical protein
MAGLLDLLRSEYGRAVLLQAVFLLLPLTEELGVSFYVGESGGPAFSVARRAA